MFGAFLRRSCAFRNACLSRGARELIWVLVIWRQERAPCVLTRQNRPTLACTAQRIPQVQLTQRARGNFVPRCYRCTDIMAFIKQRPMHWILQTVILTFTSFINRTYYIYRDFCPKEMSLQIPAADAQVSAARFPRSACDSREQVQNIHVALQRQNPSLLV